MRALPFVVLGLVLQGEVHAVEEDPHAVRPRRVPVLHKGLLEEELPLFGVVLWADGHVEDDREPLEMRLGQDLRPEWE